MSKGKHAKSPASWLTQIQPALESAPHEDAFLYDLSLPTVPLSSALDPKLPPDPVESHKSATPSGAAQALTPQQLRTGDPASPDYLTQRISLVQAEHEKLALELQLLRLKREQPSPATPPSESRTKPATGTRSVRRKRKATANSYSRRPKKARNCQAQDTPTGDNVILS